MLVGLNGEALMTDTILIDTDILIDSGRGIGEAVDLLQQIEQHALMAISVITQMELMIGCRNKKELNSLI
jgi:predicted nucleic acid-binding protein